MTDTIPGLKDLLNVEVLGHPYDPKSLHREKFMIDHLAQLVREWEIGNISFEILKNAFDKEDLGNFDLMRWMQSKADEGIYDMPVPEDIVTSTSEGGPPSSEQS